MEINFAQIPTDIRLPGVYAEIDNEKAISGTLQYPTKILAVGQMTSSGTASPLEVKRISQPGQGKAFFGRGSMLALMCEKILKNQQSVEILAIAQEDDGVGVAATGTVTFSGDASATGVLNFLIGGKRVRIKVSATDSNSEIAAKLVTAINDEKDIAVIAAVDGSTAEQVNLTAKNKGENGNSITVILNYNLDEFTPTGLEVAIVAMASGAGNPDVQDVLDAIEGQWYTDWAIPYTDAANLTVLDQALEERYAALSKIDAHLYNCRRDTFANLVTFGNGRNSPFASTIGISKDAPNPDYEWCAALCAKGAFESNQDPALPMRTVELEGILPPKTLFTDTEQNFLLHNGISNFEVNASGEVQLSRVITNYQENDIGIENTAYLDITSPKTLSHMRYDYLGFVATRYARKKITDDDYAVTPGNNMVSTKTFAASIEGREELWRAKGWTEGMGKPLVVRDADSPERFNVLLTPNVVNGLHIIATKIQWVL